MCLRTCDWPVIERHARAKRVGVPHIVGVPHTVGMAYIGRWFCDNGVSNKTCFCEML